MRYITDLYICVVQRTEEPQPDRVFSHALNTVNKIRTGSEKPPSAVRLKLYGLYKQSMGALCVFGLLSEVYMAHTAQKAMSTV